MNKPATTLVAIAATAVMIAAAGAANSSVLIDVTQSGGNVDVTASGSLDLTGATYDHSQPYSTGIISGGSNWYVALGTTPGMDWYQFTGTDLPFGTSGTYYTSGATSGDAISIWGFAGGPPLVGVATGYTSGSSISADMTLAGQTIAGMGLTPGTYTFTIPNDTVILDISSGAVPEPAIWTMMLVGIGAVGAATRRMRQKPGAVATA